MKPKQLLILSVIFFILSLTTLRILPFINTATKSKTTLFTKTSLRASERGVAIRNYFRFNCSNSTSSEIQNNLLLILPERLRGFIAARLWEKADLLMHKGPVLEKQKFSAGSYAGNTDIIPYLRMVISLCPDETAPYRLLASNYAYHLDMKEKALELLNNGILNCSLNPRLHELYASAAFIHLFASKKDFKLADSFMDKAIQNYKNIEHLSDPVFKLENYYLIKSRILWELHKPDEALKTWLLSGKELENCHDRLAKVLLRYKNSGEINKLEDLSDSHFPINKETSDEFHHNHKHHHDSIVENEETKSKQSPLQTLIRVTFQAGFAFLLSITLYFLYSRFCGTDSFSIRFFLRK